MTRALVAIALALVLSACEPAPSSSGKPVVVATFYPLYEFARQVAGDRAEVVSLVPPGVEPHDWEPSPQSVVQTRQARVLVYNGAGFEPWIDKLLTEVKRGNTVVVDASQGLPLVAAREGADPHVWLDPVLAQGEVDAIRAGLERADPGNTRTYQDNANAFKERLARLDQAFAAGLRDCARRDMVTSHTAFSYLARRYGLEQVPVMGVAPEAEPSPGALAAISRVARARGVKVVFFETLVSPRLAETIAREIGAKTLVLNPVEGLSVEEAAAGKDYVALMEVNLAHLREGLGCK